MKSRLLMTTAAGLVWAGMAMALTTDEVVQDFQGQGFTNIEVEEGPTQIKVEASNGPGTDKVEVVFDKATGEELSREIYAGQGGAVDPGVEIDDSDDDFDDEDEDEDEDEDDDDDGSDDDGSDDDGGDDDHGGGDDGGDDDHGGGDDGGDDD